MRERWRHASAAFDALDALFLVGVLVLGVGLALAWLPLGFVAVGSILAGAAFFAALPARPRGEP